MIISRAYNSFNVNPQTKSSITKVSKEVRLLGEIEYYLNLPKKLAIFYPRVISFSKESPYTLELEYYAYSNLGKRMVNSDRNMIFWENVMEFIFSYIDYYKTLPNKPAEIVDVRNMYINKTETEYNNLVNKFPFFENLSQYDVINFNNKQLKSFNLIWKRIKNYIESVIIPNTTEFSFIHGDMCFSNILLGEFESTTDIVLKFIDPRGLFGKTVCYGDFYYDLAKLSHSCNGGYEYIINDKFEIENKDNEFLSTIYNKDEISSTVFYDKISANGFDLEKIKIIEGLIFIGMCARHYDSLERQKMMYLTGLNILNEIYEKI